jgi:hypothetical protein
MASAIQVTGLKAAFVVAVDDDATTAAAAGLDVRRVDDTGVLARGVFFLDFGVAFFFATLFFVDDELPV